MKFTPTIRNNIFANFVGKAWRGIFSLAFVPIYIKIMGIESYGLIGIFMALNAVFIVLDIGLSATLSRELSRLSIIKNSEQESRNLVRTFEIIYWIIGILIGIVIIILAPVITKYWITSVNIRDETIEQALLIMGLLLAFRWPSAIYSGGLKGLQHQITFNVIKSSSILVQHIGAVLVLLFVSPSILAFFLWQSFAALLTTIVFAIWLWKLLPKSGYRSKFDIKLFLKNRKFASGMMGVSFVTILLMQIDKIVISKMLTLEMFGYYMLAFSTANILTNLVSPVHTALYPRLSQLVAIDMQTDISKLYHKGCRLASIIILPTAITLSFYAEEILSLWIGDPIIVKNSHIILSLLIIGTMIKSIMTMPYALQLAYGWTKLALYKNITALIIIIPLMIWMVNMYQGIGAAWAWIILHLGYIIFEVPIMHTRLLKGEMGRWYRQDIILPTLIVITINLISREILPVDATIIMIVSVMLSTLALTFIASAWATGNLNMQFLAIIKK